MFEFLTQGGGAMFPVLFFGFFAIAAAVMFVLRPEQRSFWRFVNGAITTFAAGLLGSSLGIVNTLQYAAHAPGAEQTTIAIAGTSESLHSISVALMLIVVSGCVVSFGLLRAQKPVSV